MEQGAHGTANGRETGNDIIVRSKYDLLVEHFYRQVT
jgi:hypothetical protein